MFEATYVLAWKHHLFLGSKEWSILTTSIAAVTENELSSFPEDVNPEACLKLAQGNEVIRIVTEGPWIARSVSLFNLLLSIFPVLCTCNLYK